MPHKLEIHWRLVNRVRTCCAMGKQAATQVAGKTRMVQYTETTTQLSWRLQG